MLDNKALSGISTLIIFIATIIIAAVAASVLLQTSQSLQSQALSTGKESQGEVSTAMRILEVIGGVKDSQTIDVLKIVVKSAPGSGSVNLDKTFLSYFDGNDYMTGIPFNNPLDDTSYGNTYESALAAADSPDSYTAYWMGSDGNYSERTTLQPEQIAVLFYNKGNIPANTTIYITVIANMGTPFEIFFTTPTSFEENEVKLYP